MAAFADFSEVRTMAVTEGSDPRNASLSAGFLPTGVPNRGAALIKARELLKNLRTWHNE
jgi:hypothetical protein